MQRQLSYAIKNKLKAFLSLVLYGIRTGGFLPREQSLDIFLISRSSELRLKHLNLYGNDSVTMSTRLKARTLADLGLSIRCFPSQFTHFCPHILPNNPWLDN